MKYTHVIILLSLGAIVYLLWDKFNAPQVPGETIYVDGKPYEVIKREIDTIKITKRDTIEKKGNDIYHDTTIYVTVKEPIDTLSVLKDYYAKKVYKDTLKLSNDIGVIIINDTIFKNTIHHRKYFTEVSEKYIHDMTIVKEAKKTQVYYGFNIGLNRTDILGSFNGGLILKTKKDKIYQLGVGFMGLPVDANVSPFVMGGIYSKIKLKK